MRIIITGLLLLFVSFFSKAQEELLDRHISMSFQQVSLTNILDSISSITNLKFAYRSDLIPEEEIISIELHNTNLEMSLNSVFSEYNIDFQMIGSEIVIYKRKGCASIKKLKAIAQKAHLQHDSITIQKEIPIVQISEEEEPEFLDEPKLPLFTHSLSFDISNKWTTNYVFNANNSDTYFLESNISLINPQLTAQLHFMRKRYQFGIGIAYNQSSINYKIRHEYQEDIPSIKFSLVEKIDTSTFYYKIQDGDTSIVYLIDTLLVDQADTTWNTVDRNDTIISKNQSLSYLSVPINFGWQIFQTKRTHFNLDGGIEPYILLSNNFSDQENDIKFHKMGIQYIFQTTYFIRIKKQLEWFISTGIQGDISNRHSFDKNSYKGIFVSSKTGLNFFL